MSFLRRLTGMQDRFQEELAPLEEVRRSLEELLQLHGYRAVETPLLEETELFLRMSGGELASRMYSFTDPGGRRVSLRPEFTASVIRAYLERRERTPLPMRVHYAGPVFRHAPGDASSYRQFTQVGAELIGSAEPLADAEILALACRVLQRAGLKGGRLVLGHVGAILGLLEALGLSERGRVFLLGSIPALKRDPQGKEKVLQKAQELGLVRDEVDGRGLQGLEDEQAHDLAQVLLRDYMAHPVGSRAPEEVLARFLRRLRSTDEPHRVERALDFVAGLAQIRDEPATALARATELAREHHLDIKPLDDCRRIVEALGAFDLDATTLALDFGFVRGIAYYTGMVFEVEHPAVSGGPSLCGGGRYDSLVKELGGPEDVPALGFACSLERLLEAANASESEQKVQEAQGSLLMPLGPGALAQAARAAERLHAQGQLVEMDVCGRSLKENLEYATARGLALVIGIGEDGEEERYPVGQ